MNDYKVANKLYTTICHQSLFLQMCFEVSSLQKQLQSFNFIAKGKCSLTTLVQTLREVNVQCFTSHDHKYRYVGCSKRIHNVTITVKHLEAYTLNKLATFLANIS